jgi:hypothetical protein
MQYIKYLISFLLVFGLTVNECSIYSPINADKQYLTSSVNTRKEIGHKHSIYVYGKKIFSKKTSITGITYRNPQDVHSTQTQIILKLRSVLYQKINTTIAENTFVKTRISSSNEYSNLYIA